jgi:hypothetical protein
LVERLPEDAPRVVSLDVAGYRRALGLSGDVDLEGQVDERSRPLLSALAEAVPFVGNPRVTPIREALDLGAVDEVASVPTFAPDQGVVVVRTSQSFDDLAGRLEDQGYERDDDVVVTQQPTTEMGGVSAVASGGDGIVILAASSKLARAVAAGEGDGPTLAPALAAVHGPFRTALSTGPDSSSCVKTVAAGWRVDPAEGDVEVTVADPADADAGALLPVDVPPVSAVELGQPKVDGRTVRASFRLETGSTAETGASPFGFMGGEATLDDIYRC